MRSELGAVMEALQEMPGVLLGWGCVLPHLLCGVGGLGSMCFKDPQWVVPLGQRLSLDCPPPQGLLQGPPCHPPWHCTPCRVGSRGNGQTARPGPLTVLHPRRGNRCQAKRTVPATASGALAGRNPEGAGVQNLRLDPHIPTSTVSLQQGEA